MRVRFYDIQWDTDGEVVGLPTDLVLDIPSDTEVAMEGADILSDRFGFCVESFQFSTNPVNNA